MENKDFKIVIDKMNKQIEQKDLAIATLRTEYDTLKRWSQDDRLVMKFMGNKIKKLRKLCWFWAGVGVCVELSYRYGVFSWGWL